MKRHIRCFSNNNNGIAAIEFALTLPIQVAMLIGVLEFGSYMLNAQMASRSVANLSHAIASDPTNPNLMEMARMHGLAVAETDVALNSDYICAQSYNTLDEAKNGRCDGTNWTTTRPQSDEANPAEAYYVALGTHIGNSSMTGLFDGLIPDIEHHEVILVAAEDENAGRDPFEGTTQPIPQREHTIPQQAHNIYIYITQLTAKADSCRSDPHVLSCQSAAFRWCREEAYYIGGVLNEFDLTTGLALVTCFGVKGDSPPALPTLPAFVTQTVTPPVTPAPSYQPDDGRKDHQGANLDQ